MDVLGYHGATNVMPSVQAWYVTGIQDNRGQVFIDDRRRTGLRVIFRIASVATCRACCRAPIPHPPRSVGGWRNRPDLSSDLLYVTIIVDSSQTANIHGRLRSPTMSPCWRCRGPQDYDDCQLMPSITNLLSPNCDDKLKPVDITATTSPICAESTKWMRRDPANPAGRNRRRDGKDAGG